MITATFVDGDALICAIPSKSKNGVYLVRVETSEDKLLVTHSCPAKRFNNNCTHIEEAVRCYLLWRWWIRKGEIVEKSSQVTLQPHWEQIPVPGSLESVLYDVLKGDIRAIRAT